MAQHESCFAGSVVQGSCVLVWIAAGRLCILRTNNLNHPHTLLQRSWSTALLVAAPPQRFPSQTVATLHRFLLGIAQATSCAIRPQNPLGHFWRHFFGTAKTQNFWAKFFKAFSGHKQAKFGQFCICGGCGLQNSAAILRRPVPHVGFCLEESISWPQKTQKGRVWQKTLREYFGFSAAILRKIFEGQNPSPNGPDCTFKRSQNASEVLQALSPLTATSLLVLAVW